MGNLIARKMLFVCGKLEVSFSYLPMGIDREIQHLARRLNKISPIISPPTLRVITQSSEEPEPEGLGPWDLLVLIEPKKVCGP